MRFIAPLLSASVFTLALAASLGALAQSATDATKADSAMASPGADDMTEGEVRKIDKENKKITIKHGEIKNLEMPGMTMVFQLKDPSVLDTLKAGDKVKFRAEKSGGTLMVTQIQAAN